MKLFVSVVFLIFFSLGFAQIQKDLSFTNESELKKVLKKFPSVTLAIAPVSADVKEIKDIPYHSLEDRKLRLDGYFNRSAGNKPAVILIHGGGWKSGDKEMMMPLAQSIASQGYHCFAVEYRLSGEAKYPAGIDDMLKAIRFLKSNAARFNIDADKIAVLGTSSGGQMAALIGTKYSELVSAVIDIDGILAFSHPQSQEGTLAAEWLGGTYQDKPEIWNDASPLYHVDRNSVPVLFINSQYERFQAGRTEMTEVLNRYSIYSRSEKIANSPHTFWMFNPWFEPTVKYVTQFLNKQFKP